MLKVDFSRTFSKGRCVAFLSLSHILSENILNTSQKHPFRELGEIQEKVQEPAAALHCTQARVSDTGTSVSIKVGGTHCALLRLGGRVSQVEEGGGGVYLFFGFIRVRLGVHARS